MSSTSRKLTLHIGTGKAGSSSIQDNLMSLRESSGGVLPVQAFGLPSAKFLAMSCRSKRAHAYFVTGRKIISEDDFQENATSVWQNARHEIESSGAHSFVSSCEFVRGMVRGDDIKVLKQALDQLFDQTDIVVYLRDQRSFLHSLWAQSVKGPSKSSKSFPEFLSHIENRRYSWDYSNFLKDWLNVFGADSLKVSMLDPQSLHGGDVVSDFYHKAGIDEAVIRPEERKNVSPGWRRLEKFRVKNWARQNPDAVKNQPADWQGIDQEQYEAFVLEKVSEGNHWVNETFFKNQTVKLPVGSLGTGQGA